MAIIEVSSTKKISALLNYAANKEKVGAVSTLNLISSGDNVKQIQAEMYNTRKLYNKNSGRQGYHIIQSFKGLECSAAIANKLGQELAKKIAPGHEVVIYTHVNTANIHNHIVINSVNAITGKKFHQTNFKGGKKGTSKGNSINLVDIKAINDEICKENELSVVDTKAKKRESMAERQLKERGEKPWKQDLRMAIDIAKVRSKNFGEFKQRLEKDGIKVQERGKNITFRHPATKQNVRGSTLGEQYTKENINQSFSKEKIANTPFEKMQEIRQKMNNEQSPEKRAELQQQFNEQKQQFEQQAKERKPERERANERSR